MAPAPTSVSAPGKATPTMRKVDIDPFFDNTRIELPGKGKSAGAKPSAAPYKPRNTYVAPNGDRQDYLKNTEGMTAMQRHVAYFDGDCDGVIWPTDTFFGFLALGFGVFLSALAVGIIHGPFSYPTLPVRGNRILNYLPDPFMRIYVANIHRCKHGSDTESYNRRGEFQPNKFADILEDYSTDHNKEGLSFRDAVVMIYERRNLMDFFGVFAFAFEWGSSYMLLWPKDGYMKKDDMIGIIDGSTFVVLAHRVKSGKAAGAFRAK